MYSTHGARVRCDEGRNDRPGTAVASRRDGVIRIGKERGGRGGKVVTVIHGLPSDGALVAVAAELKRLCGAGGTVKGDTVEIQGDHRDRLTAWFRERGCTVKLAGG